MGSESLRRPWAGMAAVLLAVGVLPLAGAYTAGRDLGRLLQFPPSRDIPSDFPRFSWVVPASLGLFFLSLARQWFRARSGEVRNPPGFLGAGRRFPVWGGVALVWTGAWWVLAWNRFHWFSPLQPDTFFPLWLGFVIFLNALSWRRCGTCLLVRAPGSFALLFAASAAFWWIFEWLNRFAGNWHYLGVDNFGPVRYAAHATLCFSTVLPAVASVQELIAASPAWDDRLRRGPAESWLSRKPVGWLLIAAGAAGLFLTGARPWQFYPSLWVAPLALAWGGGIVAGRPGVWSELAAGDWRRAGSWSLAALVCGLFWEMWNVHSFAQWIYTVPYANRWHVFEMPLLGYAGYLPFGLECLLACEWAAACRADPVGPTAGSGTRQRFDSDPVVPTL